MAGTATSYPVPTRPGSDAVPSRIRRAAALIAVSAAALVILAGIEPASASCAMPPPLDEAVAAAPIAFVGTATDVRDGTIAHFAVEEIWAGPDLVEVTVHGGEGGGAVTSVDRSFLRGERYLVLPYTDGAELRDNSCTSTQVWTEELARLRPADARTVDATTVEGEPAGSDGSSLPWILAAIGAGVVLLAGGTAWGLARHTREAR